MPGGYIEITAVARVRYVHDRNLKRGERDVRKGKGDRTVEIGVKDYVEAEDRFIEVMMTKRYHRPSKKRLRRVRAKMLRDVKDELRGILEARGETWSDVAMTGVWGTEAERAEVQRPLKTPQEIVDLRTGSRRVKKPYRPERSRRKKPKRGGRP